MKRCGLLFLSLVFLIYAYQAYLVVYQSISESEKIKTSSRISEIAGDVAAIPLQTPDSGAIRQVRRVQSDGNHLFMIADQRLLQFDRKGNFIRQLTTETGNDVFIADYTLDTERRQVIAIDSQRFICTFDYDGNRIRMDKLNQPWQKLTAMTYSKGNLWLSAEKLVKNPDNPESFFVIHNLYRFDSDMNELSCQKIRVADVGRDELFNSYLVDELRTDEHGVYAYTTPPDMEHLLSDTLHILLRHEVPLLFKNGYFGEACIYPIRKGKRYLIASNNHSVDNSYTFCYDRTGYTAYKLTKGFKDDVHKTGYINDLQSMDATNQSYCYLKSGASLTKKFPKRAISEDAPVLFIVTLKS